MPWNQRGLDAVDYWLAHAHGADFVSVDGWSTTRDAGWLTDPVSAAPMFAAVTEWLRSRTSLPVWWSEFYPVTETTPLDVQRDATLAALDGVRQAGGAVVLLWSPQADGAVCWSCLWSDPRSAPATLTPLGLALA